jgi:hypothetical protein
MSTQYGSPQAAPAPPPAGNRGCGCFLGSCLGVVIVCLLLCGGVIGGAVIFRERIFQAIKGPLVDAASKAAEQAVTDSQMSPEDKQVVREQVRRVAGAYKRGQITTEQVIEIMESLAQSPVFVVAVVYVVEQKYVVPSGLSEEEKTAAHRTLQRTARGVYEEKITENQLDAALQHIATKNAEGKYELKEHVSDEELRAFLAECRRLADEAEIPDEDFEVNIGEEFKKAVDAELDE